MNRLRVVRRAVLVAAMCVLVCSVAAAQTTGRVEGRIVGAGGTPVADATVKARHVATDTIYTVNTDDGGRYIFAALPPGTYEVRAVAPSFPEATRMVEVALAAQTTVDFDPTTPRVVARPVRAGLAAVELEVSGRVGWTFSDGVGDFPVQASDGNIYDRIDISDAFSWGLTIGMFVTRALEVEFLVDRQRSTLAFVGTSTRELGDLDVGNYHVVMSLNFGNENSSLRPFLFGGAGATTYSSLSFVSSDGQARATSGNTRLSPTFGGGIKMYRGIVGARLEARVTPTYIKGNTGWWCDPYWGCHVTYGAQYAVQAQLSSGITVRF